MYSFVFGANSCINQFYKKEKVIQKEGLGNNNLIISQFAGDIEKLINNILIEIGKYNEKKNDTDCRIMELTGKFLSLLKYCQSIFSLIFDKYKVLEDKLQKKKDKKKEKEEEDKEIKAILDRISLIYPNNPIRIDNFIKKALSNLPDTAQLKAQRTGFDNSLQKIKDLIKLKETEQNKGLIKLKETEQNKGLIKLKETEQNKDLIKLKETEQNKDLIKLKETEQNVDLENMSKAFNSLAESQKSVNAIIKGLDKKISSDMELKSCENKLKKMESEYENKIALLNKFYLNQIKKTEHIYLNHYSEIIEASSNNKNKGASSNDEDVSLETTSDKV